MLESIFIYILFYGGSAIFALHISKAYKLRYNGMNSTRQKHDWNFVWTTPYSYLFVLLFAFVVGFRYNVGPDYLSYVDIVKFAESHYYYEHIELYPKLLIDLVHNYGLHWIWWFFLMAFTQAVLMITAIRKNNYRIAPIMILVFIALHLYTICNESRFALALAMVFLSWIALSEKKWLFYFICFACAYCLHRSSLVLFPLCWIISFVKIPNVKYQLLIFIIASITFAILVGYLIDNSMSYWFLIGQDDKIATFQYDVNDSQEWKSRSGLGVLLRMVVYVILIINSKRIEKKYSWMDFSTFYKMMFVGMCTYYGWRNTEALIRFSQYFTYADILVIPIALHYLYKLKSPIAFIQFSILLLYCITNSLFLFIGKNGWQFIWDIY